MHDALKKLRKAADEHDAVLIGETWTRNISELQAYYGQGNNELQMPMDSDAAAAAASRRPCFASTSRPWTARVAGPCT